jgi:hypothetical protein
MPGREQFAFGERDFAGGEDRAVAIVAFHPR